MNDYRTKMWGWLCGFFLIATFILLVAINLPSLLQTQTPQLLSLTGSWLLTAGVGIKKIYFAGSAS